ncbi:MAG: histidine ammonia-lyase [Ruminococcaceae bacterium]|nr:histidine ammonia-lyase [Oscillospiraceae bacterium]
MHHVVVDGHSLDLESFVAVARFRATVELSPAARASMERSRALADKIAAEGRIAYGITTGFGEFQKVAVPKEMSNRLSTNLILSHCTATGEPYAPEIVRGMMLLRANALCGGVSGVRPILVEMLLDMLNRGVIPVVPEKGSLGSSGDLAPLAHLTLPMLGRGEAFYGGERLSGAEAMSRAGISTLDTLVSKEGLGMTNGTCAMTSVGALALYDAICAAQLADVIASLSFEGLTVQTGAFDRRIHAVRGQKGQITVAANLRALLQGSEIIDRSQNDQVQDAYAVRCVPQLHGACRDALAYVREKVEIELNAVTDNPLMFPEDEAVISGGNFHGEPLALPFDFLGIAAAELANASERRIERMVNGQLSNGLTPFLTTQPGINSGFMIVQYAAASMVSENKVYAHPASVDSIPSSMNQEDIVSMGTTAARKARMILRNTQDVLAYELMTACQAIDIRRRADTHGQGITPLHQALYDHVREKVSFMEIDREIWPDLRLCEAMIRSGELLEFVHAQLPEFM